VEQAGKAASPPATGEHVELAADSARRSTAAGYRHCGPAAPPIGGWIVHVQRPGERTSWVPPSGDVNQTADLRCAVAVQRALTQHRRAHGFAPQVRIGVHAGEATRRGRDFGGGQVHAAARIAALAEGGEILVSEETVVDGGFQVRDLRDVILKGIPGPIRVGTLEWR
jgi:adenylate cyclase